MITFRFYKDLFGCWGKAGAGRPVRGCYNDPGEKWWGLRGRAAV